MRKTSLMKTCQTFYPIAGTRSARIPCVHKAEKGSHFCRRHGDAIFWSCPRRPGLRRTCRSGRLLRRAPRPVEFCPFIAEELNASNSVSIRVFRTMDTLSGNLRVKIRSRHRRGVCPPTRPAMNPSPENQAASDDGSGTTDELAANSAAVSTDRKPCAEAAEVRQQRRRALPKIKLPAANLRKAPKNRLMLTILRRNNGLRAFMDEREM